MAALDTSPKSSPWLLMIFPIAVAVIGIGYLFVMSPIYGGGAFYNYDPVYTYLFNGLTLLDGNAPDHIDHPGTPLQVLVAMVVYVRWLFSGAGGDVINAALNNPEEFITTVSAVLLAINVWATFYVGKKVLTATKSVLSVMLCQSAPLFFSVSSVRLVYLSPEALLIAASLVLFGLLAGVIFRQNENSNLANASPLLVGLTCGFGLAVKITFLPMLGFIFLLGSARNIAHGALFSVLGLVIFTSPALVKIERYIEWLSNLIMGSDMYGTGTREVINVTAMSERLLNMASWFSLFYFVIFLMIFVMFTYAFGQRKDLKINLAIPAVFTMAASLQTIMVLKHFSLHYMMPSVFIGLFGLVWFVRSGAVPSLVGKSINRVLLFSLVGVLASAVWATWFNFDLIKSDRTQQAKSIAIINDELAKHPNALVLGTHMCVLKQCAMGHGMWHTPSMDSHMGPKLENFVWYNIFNNMVYVPTIGWQPLSSLNEQMGSGRDVLLLSRNYLALGDFKLDELVNAGEQSLYRVRELPNK